MARVMTTPVAHNVRWPSRSANTSARTRPVLLPIWIAPTLGHQPLAQGRRGIVNIETRGHDARNLGAAGLRPSCHPRNPSGWRKPRPRTQRHRRLGPGARVFSVRIFRPRIGCPEGRKGERWARSQETGARRHRYHPDPVVPSWGCHFSIGILTDCQYYDDRSIYYMKK
jgi:hypothetical protein